MLIHERGGVETDLDRNAELLPTEREHHAGVGQLAELVLQPFAGSRSDGCDRCAEGVFRFLVEVASPRRRVGAEDQCPFPGCRDHVYAVGPGGHRLPLDTGGMREGDRRVLVRSRAPDLSIGDHLSPDLASFHPRPMIIDLYLGDTDRLRDRGCRTGLGTGSCGWARTNETHRSDSRMSGKVHKEGFICASIPLMGDRGECFIP